MTWFRSADASLVLAFEVARVGLIIAGCIVTGWVVGFGMGYRRGMTDGATGDFFEPDHRISGD